MTAVQLDDALVSRLEAHASQYKQTLNQFITGLLDAHDEQPGLSEELRQYQRAVEQSPSAVVITDTAGRITYVNLKFTQLTGYTAEEVRGQNPRILKSGHTPAAEYARLWATITAGGEWHGEFLNKKKNGDLYWEYTSISPITNAQGEITHFLAVKEDITRRKAAEADLRASEARYQALFDHTHDAVFLIDLNYNLIEVNQQAAQIIGYTPQEMRGRSMTDFLMPDEREKSRQKAEQLRTGALIPLYERRFQHKDGHEVITEISAALIHDADGQPAYFQSIVRDITERKRMEQALRASEARFRAIVKTIPDLILRVRADYSVFEYISPGSGMDLSPLPETIHVRDLLSAESAEQVMAATDRALRTRELQLCEYRIRQDDTGQAYEEARVVADSAETVLVLVRDITERKMMQAALQEREQTAREFQEYLRRLHEAHIELAQAATLNELCRMTVELGLQLLGFDRMGLMLLQEDGQALVGTYGTDIHGKVRAERDYYSRVGEKDAWVQNLFTGREYVALWDDVSLRDYDQDVGRGWNAVSSLWDGRQTLGCIVVDNLLHKRPARPFETDLLLLYGSIVGHLIARKRAEETLRISENRFRTLLEAAPVGVLLVDQQGRIMSSNHKTEALFGYTAAELSALVIEDLLPQADRAAHTGHRADFFANPRQRLMGIGLDLYGQRKDGSRFPIEVALSFIPLEDDILALAFVADVTERKQFERQNLELVLERERTDILAKFIRDAAHELRTPLSIINTNLYLMSRVSEAERLDELRSRIQAQTDSLSGLIDAMTLMMRLDDDDIRSDPAVVNINTTLRAIISRMQESLAAKPIYLTMNLCSYPLLVRGDAGNLAIALTCLLDNAQRYTPAGGSITLTSQADQQHVVITIADTGIGMSSAVQERIFERFFRADEARTTRGFGLGLPIARRIIEKHQGSILVESAPGQGSTFQVRLPLDSPA